MSCLALSLQPSNGRDILVQTREWFPPYRALVATSAFRQTRLAFAAAKNQSANRPSVDDPSKADFIASLGDDPLAASSGQLIVGAESRYRVVYRLVNGIYVLGITVADHDNSVNVFECIHIVNQAVSVIVTACRGVDVTPEKLNKKYAEIYMALDIVLRGVSNIRLAAMLSSMHGDGIAKMVHSALDTENKIRGADSWASAEALAVDHQATVDVFSSLRLELPAETIAAGDEAKGKLAPLTSVQQDQKQEKEEELVSAKDPFAASDLINTQEELVVEFKKDKSPSVDLSVALAGLEVTPLPPAEATVATRVSVEGFEGDYGGIEFSNEQASLGETFEGFSEAWGGGLDASEFVGPKDITKKQGLGGLELLQTGDSRGETPMEAKDEKGSAGTVENLLVQKTESKGPEIYIVEDVRAEFRESLLARVGLMGVIYLRNAPSKTKGDRQETEFSFRLDNTSSVKRCVIHGSKISSIGGGLFHVRAGFSDEPVPILKYSLLPRLTPLPLRVRLLQRLSGTFLSVMVQYVSNPDLAAPLVDVTFVLKLPVDPSLLKVAPKAVLNRADRELKWHVPEIPLLGFPGCMRARMPLHSSSPSSSADPNAIDVYGSVQFSVQGSNSLSGVSILPASEGNPDFFQGTHRYASGNYIYN